ncbi:MAG TPA: hypothetical protein DFS52_17575 [Myxococcales bacterium]|nr:hypothetical protein [Myxococcales bacterium]
MRLPHHAACALLVLLLSACPDSESPTGPGGSDAGARVDGGDGGGTTDPDGGRPRIVWPEATHVVEGAHEAGLVLSPSGIVTLAYKKEQKVWTHRDPPTGAPVALGDALSSGTELRIFASPTEDRAFVAWTGRYGVSLTAGVPDSERLTLYYGEGELYTLGGGWFGGMPALIARSGEVHYSDGTQIPGRHLAFTVPIDATDELPLPEPREENALATVGNSFHHYDESETLVDLGDGTALMFDRWTEKPPGDDTERDHARWRILRRSVLATGSRAHYLLARTGTFALPDSPAAWIRAFSLGGGKYALAWGSTPDTLVFDVFLAGFELNEAGEPFLTTGSQNISMTTGATDNSDFPLVAPVGDGRFWLAWREVAFGPRVALMSADFKILAIGAPNDELGCDLSGAMGAAADSEGTLHLVAGFSEDDGEYGRPYVRYFRIALP